MKTVKIHYFKDCKTIEEVKNLYKKLAKEHHPDKGGSLENMQALNTEYSYVCLLIARDGGLNEQETETTILNAEAYKKAVDAIITCEGLIIELIGTWIWVSGETKIHKEALKAGGFSWNRTKEKWFFRTGQFKSYNRKSMAMDDIRNKYGSETIKGKPGQHLKAS